MTDQLVMDLPTWPDQPKRSVAAVEVNECHVALYGSRPAMDWWVTYRHLGNNESRCCVSKRTIVGDLLHVHCENHAHAEWLRELLLAHDIAKAAVKVLRLKVPCPSVNAELSE